MHIDLTGKNALITGGTSGIGRAVAIALADSGCACTVTGLTEEEVRNFDSEGLSITALSLDVRDEQAISVIVDDFTELDILVNCAGMILRDGKEFETENFAAVVDVNLLGTQRMCAACFSLLSRSNGCVLNLASMLSFFGSGFSPAYSSSKGGIAQLTKSLAIAWAKHGVRVNAIAPGWIETALTEGLRADSERSATVLDRTPMNRWGTPDDVTGAAVFLCSNAARFITGIVLPVDGGYSIV